MIRERVASLEAAVTAASVYGAMPKQVECQNGHPFSVDDHAHLPYRCVKCNAPARPVPRFVMMPRSGPILERLVRYQGW